MVRPRIVFGCLKHQPQPSAVSELNHLPPNPFRSADRNLCPCPPAVIGVLTTLLGRDLDQSGRWMGGTIIIHEHTRVGTGFHCTVLVTPHCPALNTAPPPPPVPIHTSPALSIDVGLGKFTALECLPDTGIPIISAMDRAYYCNQYHPCWLPNNPRPGPPLPCPSLTCS